jgi:hypothetical protein
MAQRERKDLKIYFSVEIQLKRVASIPRKAMITIESSVCVENVCLGVCEKAWRIFSDCQ